MNVIRCLTARWATAAVGMCAAFQLVAGIREISSPALRVRVDTAFPRVVDYQWKANAATLYGREEALHEVAINGTNYTPKVRFNARGKDTVTHVLGFPSIQVEITVRMKVTDNVLEFAVTHIKESGPVKLMTMAIPNHSLISVRSTQPGAAFIGSQVGKADVQALVADRRPDAKPVPFTHAVLYDQQLAGSIYNNVLLDNERLFLQTRDAGQGKVCSLWCPVWTYRVVANETLPLPLARVVVTGDLNGDGVVDWQDGALAYRPLEPLPLGADLVKKRITSQIAMNFASYAQHPFLRVLDSVKMMYLQTDGLGQEIQFKGYQAEGHDSSHPDYGGNVGRRPGGRDEFNYVMRRMKDFNATAGIHINATEYYPEAKHYSLDLVNTNKPGWAWLDQSFYTDQHYDIVSGKLYQRLEEIRADLPTLDWVYVDVYFGVGWEAYKLATKMNSLGLPIYTEFPWLMERYVSWNHTSQDWTQKIWGDGRKSRLARFIQNTSRDVWPHDPLLRGSQNDGFLGWHSQRDVNAVVRSTFVVNLPSKYLQHFPIKRWADKRIDFEGGVYATEEGGTMKIYRNGKLWNSCRYPGTNCPPTDCVLFMPWDPIRETKIYHWNDAGGATTWQLPESWQALKEILLYELTPLGRVRVSSLPVRGGQVTVDARPRTPYVLYKEPPPSPLEVVWGEGSPVKDPGFDSASFNWWKPFAPSRDTSHIGLVRDSKGQAHLRIKGNNGAAGGVSQRIYGLEGGQTYSASVWAELKGKRAASLTIRPVTDSAPRFVAMDRPGWKIVHADSEEKGDKEGPAALLLDGDKSTIWHTEYQNRRPGYPHEVVVDMAKERTSSGFYYTPRANRGNGTIENFEFYVSRDGSDWGKAVVAGSFSEHDQGGESFEVLFDEPVTARYFKLVATSAMFDDSNESPFASGAELGMLEPAADKSGAGAFAPVTVQVDKTDARNYSDNADKYLTYYQRIRVLFDVPMGLDKAELVLKAEAGAPDSAAAFDDVRVVKTRRSDARGHDYFEDFENVDEGWGPFVYGYQGSTQTHLSEAHSPYTDDTIEGQFSLKTFDEDNGLNFRTIPARLRFQPSTKYRLSFDYKTRNSGQYRVVMRSDDGGPIAEKLALDLPGEPMQTQHFTAEFTTGAFGDYYLGIVKNAGDKWKGPKPGIKGAADTRAVLVLDNLAVDPIK